MGVFNHFLLIFIHLHLSSAIISDKRLCIDPECSKPISEAKTLTVYYAPEKFYLSFKPNEKIVIYSKSAGSNLGLWGAEIRGKRGYIPRDKVRETKVLGKPELLVDTEIATNVDETKVPSENGNVNPTKVKENYEIVDGTTLYMQPELEDVETNNHDDQPKILEPNKNEIVEEQIEMNSNNFESIEEMKNMEDTTGETGDIKTDSHEPVSSQEDSGYLSSVLGNMFGKVVDEEDAKSVHSEVVQDAESVFMDSSISNDSKSMESETDLHLKTESGGEGSVGSENIELKINIPMKLDTSSETIDENLNGSTVESMEVYDLSKENTPLFSLVDKENTVETDISLKTDESLNEKKSFLETVHNPENSTAGEVEKDDETKSNSLPVREEDEREGNSFNIPDLEKNSYEEPIHKENSFVGDNMVNTEENKTEVKTTDASSKLGEAYVLSDKKLETEIMIDEQKESENDSFDETLNNTKENQTMAKSDVVKDLKASVDNYSNKQLETNSMLVGEQNEIQSDLFVGETLNSTRENETIDTSDVGGKLKASFDSSNEKLQTNTMGNKNEKHKEPLQETVGNQNEKHEDLMQGPIENVIDFIASALKSSDENDQSESIEKELENEKTDSKDIYENAKNSEKEISPNDPNLIKDFNHGIIEEVQKVGPLDVNYKSYDANSRNGLKYSNKNGLNSYNQIKDLTIEVDESSSTKIDKRNDEYFSQTTETGKVNHPEDVSSQNTIVLPNLNERVGKNFMDDIIHEDDIPHKASAILGDLSMEFPNLNSDFFLYLLTTAISVIIFLMGYFVLDKSRREGPLIEKINRLEKELLVAIKEKEDAEDGIQHENFVESQDYLDLKQQYEEMIAEKQKIEEQVQYLEKELENSTEVGLELNRMLSDMLSSENAGETLMSNIEGLQAQLAEQQGIVSNMKETLNLKETENHELNLELDITNKKVVELQSELDKLLLNLIKIEEEKDSQEKNLKSEIANMKTNINLLNTTLENNKQEYSKELNSLKQELSISERNLQVKSKEYLGLKESMQQIKDMKNANTLDSLLEVTSIKAELEQLKSECKLHCENLKREKDLNMLLDKRAKESENEMDEFKKHFDEVDKSRLELETKLQVLTNYFKEKESQLLKEISKYENMWSAKQGEASSTSERIKYLQSEVQNYKSQNESLKQEIVSQEVELKGQISVLEKKVHENWVSARQAERRLEDLKQEAAQLRNRLTLRERALQEDKTHNRMQSPLEQNSDLMMSSLQLESPSSPPLLYSSRDHITKSPPIIGMPPPFLAHPPPGAPFLPPPHLPFMPPPPEMFPGDHRPPPLGRMSSPPLNSRYSPDRRPYSPYERRSPSPSYDESEYGTSPVHHRRYSPFNGRKSHRRIPISSMGKTNGGNMSSGSGNSNESLDEMNHFNSKV